MLIHLQACLPITNNRHQSSISDAVAVLEGIGSAAKCSVHRRQSVLLALAALLVLPAVYSLTRSDSAKKSVLTLMSEPYRLDKIYRSMEGPWSVPNENQLPAPKSPAVQGGTRRWAP